MAKKRNSTAGIGQGYDPQGYERLKSRLGVVFTPSAHSPKAMLPVIQYFTRGGLEGDEGMSRVISRHFGSESIQWGHFANWLHFFDFKARKGATKAAVSVILGFLYTLRATMGTEGAFRFWLMIFDFAFSDAQVKIDAAEPVAVLTKYKDKTEYDDGWDVHFPAYTQMTFHTFRNHVSMRELQSYQLGAASGSEYAKHVANMLMQTLDGAPFTSPYNRPATGGHLDGFDSFMGGALDLEEEEATPDMSWMVDGMTDGMLGELLRANAHLIPTDEEHGETSGGPIPFKQHMDRLAVSPLSRPALWPIRGGTSAQLADVKPIQAFGVIRRHPVRDGERQREITYRHTGLDLEAAKGTPIVSCYAGRVTKAVGDWEPSDRGNLKKSRGNYVRVTYGDTPGQELPGGGLLVLEYLHLDRIAEGIEVGAEVDQGSVLGYADSTGNSTGHHLHLEARWILPSRHGRDSKVYILNPATMLKQGALAAAREAKVPLNVTRPIIGGAVWALSSIVSPKSITPPRYGGILESLLKGASNIFDSMDDLVDDAADEIRDLVGKEAFETARKAVVDLTDDVLDWAQGDGSGVVRTFAGIAGLGDYADAAVDVLDRAWDAGQRSNYTDSGEMFEAGLRQLVTELEEAGAGQAAIDRLIGGLKGSDLIKKFFN